MASSWKPEVQTDGTGRWYDNGVRFATAMEAIAWATDRSLRWSAVRDFRAVETEDAPNYAWSNGAGLVPLPEPATPVKLSDLPDGTPLTITWRTEA